MTLGLNSRRDSKDNPVAVVIIGKNDMMGGTGSGLSPKFANPRILGDEDKEEGVPSGSDDGESQHGVVTLIEVKNNPNILQHSQSRENLEFQAAPPPIGGTIWNSPAGNNQTRKSSLTDFDKELLGSQFAKKERLRLVVKNKQSELVTLRRDVQFLHQQLEPLLRIEKLKKDNERLQHQCNIMTTEVDSYTDGSIPLGETSAEFYRERSPRQDGNPSSFLQTPSTPSGSGGIPGASSGSRSPVGRYPTGSHQAPTATTRKIPPPRPPPPNSLLLRNIPPNWECSSCTFRNHPDLSICEFCEMIRVVVSPHPSSGSQSQGHGQSTPSPPYYYPQPRSAS